MSPKINQSKAPKASAKMPRQEIIEKSPVPTLPKGPRIKNAIGLLELNSIAKGIEATDLMLKASDVELLMSRSICSGKYVVLVRGDVAACASSVAAGEAVGRESVADSIVIPNLHEQIFPAIAQANLIEDVEALGVLEAFDVASLIEGTDAAVKAAQVRVLEIRLAMALGGKAFSVLTGQVAAVRAAIEAGKLLIGSKGLLTNWAVIPAPKAELVKELLGGRLI
jgi:microcompartment protein CcmL/EutN